MYLQRLCKGDEQRIHSNPVVNVDVGKGVAGHVVEERQVQKAALLPVHLGIGEDEMQDGHQQDVRGQEDEQRVVHARTEGV